MMPSIKARFNAMRTLKRHGKDGEVAEIFRTLTPTERKEFYEFLSTHYYYEEKDFETQMVEDICYFSTINKIKL